MTNSYIEKLNKIYIDITKNISKNPEAIKYNMRRLEKTLLNKKFSKSQEQEIINLFKYKLRNFQSNYELFETNLELKFSNKLAKTLKVNIDYAKKYLLYKRFTILIKNEIQLGNILCKDKVLFIGSGPFPSTAIILNKLTECKIDCFDKCKSYVDLSRKVIRKLSVSNDIKIYHKSGELLKKNKYDVIIIALLANPKEKILSKILEKSRSGTRIICRTSDGVRQLFYKTTNPRIFIKYAVQNKNYADRDQTVSSVLLVK